MFSQTAEYAFRAMTYLAGAEGPAGSERIAAEVKVPKPYLLKILRDLVGAGLLDSQRGPNGGFVLGRPAADITMLEVLNAVDRLNRIKACPLGNPAHVTLCPLHRRLDDSIAHVERSLCQTTLAELAGSIVPNEAKPAERRVRLSRT